MNKNDNCNFLVGVSETAHSAHYAEHIVVGSVNADLCCVVSANGVGGKDKLEGSVINTGHIASATWLVFLWAKGKRVDVDTSVWRACVMLVRLNEIEVRSFTL